MLAVVEDLADSNQNADDDADDDEYEWTGERGDVNTARLVNVQRRRMDVRHPALHLSHVPTLTSLPEPT